MGCSALGFLVLPQSSSPIRNPWIILQSSCCNSVTIDPDYYLHQEVSMRISAPFSAIIITLILVVGLLFGLGKFDKEPPPSYATVSFDGGYKKIGVISSERIYTRGTITKDGDTFVSGDFDELIKWIKDSAEDQSLDQMIWKPGVNLEADAGIEWIASKSNFKLTTDSLDITSTEAVPLVFQDIISHLEELEQNAKLGREATAKSSLSFGDNPNVSFIISKVMHALKKLTA